MRKFSFVFSILFLLISFDLAFAAEVKLEDTSTVSDKLISLSVDTKEETTDTIKIVLKASEGVDISDVQEGALGCSTFSSVPNKNIVEIICTFSLPKTISGKLADIKFTTASESYDFTVDETQSEIGKLKIDNVVNIGDMQIEQSQTTNNSDTSETTEETTTSKETTETTPKTTSQTVAKKQNGFMDFLPYILLGAAGIFLISIIVLLITKKKDDVKGNTMSLPNTPNKEAVVPQLITQPETTSQPLPETSVEQIVTETSTNTSPLSQESKPTLAELVGVTPEISPELPITEPVSETTSSESREQADLDALLRSENPSINTIPQEQVVNTPTIENSQVIENSYVEDPRTEIPSGYSANVSTGGLPEVGSTSPLENLNQNTSITPANEPVPYKTSTVLNEITGENNPVEQIQEPIINAIGDTSLNQDFNQTPSSTTDVETQPINEAIEVTPMIDPDLQNLVNQEISNIPTNPIPSQEQIQTPIASTNTGDPINPM
ncbi:hypothetical protein KBB69_00160 [Candidatus Dojkabacteria bacterium]|nr:hypothetical protein [Candidatus Dojkabacteria bacterium]HRZ84741.1 hypothetical protein [Candidatus Dojkabacteria bacterium]